MDALTTLPGQNNKGPILEALQKQLSPQHNVLELGSGTGQHLGFLAANFPQQIFYPSDAVPDRFESIEAWIAQSPTQNIQAPRVLRLGTEWWLEAPKVESLLLINVLQTIGAAEMSSLVQGCMNVEGLKQVLIYSPFKRNGQFVSESDQRFDEWIKQKNGSQAGVKDLETLTTHFDTAGFKRLDVLDMPKGNFFVHFKAHR